MIRKQERRIIFSLQLVFVHSIHVCMAMYIIICDIDTMSYVCVFLPFRYGYIYIDVFKYWITRQVAFCNLRLCNQIFANISYMLQCRACAART